MSTRAARRVLRHCVLLAVPAGIPYSAAAADPPRAVAIAWHCTQESDASFHVLCIPRLADVGPESAALVPLPTSTATATTAPAAAPGSDMRPVAQRGDAEVLSAPAWRLPLHTRPTDGDMVRQLLMSVLCGTHPACSIRYDQQGLRVAGG